jgi:hypothetical protein
MQAAGGVQAQQRRTQPARSTTRMGLPRPYVVDRALAEKAGGNILN